MSKFISRNVFIMHTLPSQTKCRVVEKQLNGFNQTQNDAAEG